MPEAKGVTSQTEFLAGEVDPSIKRGNNHPLFKSGARQMSNWRILNSAGVKNRPGRNVLFSDGPRVEQVLMSVGNTFFLVFGDTYLRVYNASGVQVFQSVNPMLWTAATARDVVWDIYKLSIYIAFPGVSPQILTWDGISQTSTWTLVPYTVDTISQPAIDTTITALHNSGFGDFAQLIPTVVGGVITAVTIANPGMGYIFGSTLVVTGSGAGANLTANVGGGSFSILSVTINSGGAGYSQVSSQSRTIFYRISPRGITMLPSGTGGSVTLTFSPGMNLEAGHIGTRMRFCGRQLLITAVASAISATATVMETLPSSTTLTFGTNPQNQFQAGEVVTDAVTGATGVVTSFPGGVTMTVQNLTMTTFGNDLIVGPNGSLTATATATGNPVAVAVWDDEVMNSFRGWPASVFIDQGRLGLCNFPALPTLIAWSRFGAFTDLYPGPQPTDAIAEVVPGNSQVLYVVPGMESSEFAFCNNAIYYIPITVQNPLKPGGVAFNHLTADGCAQVQPRHCQQSIVYISLGGLQIKAVQAIGSYSRPYIVEDLSELHAHLLNVPFAIAVPSAGSPFEERYMYFVNNDGSLLVAKYVLKEGVINKELIGFVPWSGVGSATYVAAEASDTIFSALYAPNSITPVPIAERLNDMRYLDCSQKYNTQPAGLPIPGGKGPLWWIAGGTVDLMDGPAGTRMMGTYIIDSNGFLIPQGNAGEDFTSANLVVGQAWTATLEPFIPSAQAGQDVEQRMWMRRLRRVQVYVMNSTGFVMARLYSDQSGPQLPAVGTVMKLRRIATWNVGEDPTLPPPLREQSYLDRPIGRSHDPRWCIIKDTPGPLTVVEISTQVTV